MLSYYLCICERNEQETRSFGTVREVIKLAYELFGIKLHYKHFYLFYFA